MHKNAPGSLMCREKKSLKMIKYPLLKRSKYLIIGIMKGKFLEYLLIDLRAIIGGTRKIPIRF